MFPEHLETQIMALADDLEQLGRRTFFALEASHDYFTYTKRVWRLMKEVVKEGREFRFRNLTTGTTIDQVELRDRAQSYISEYLRSSTFQHFVSLFENFWFDLLHLWLLTYPDSLSKKQLQLDAVLKAPNKSAIITAVIEKELNELKYARAADWFAYFETLAKLGCPLPYEVETVTEIKASRDILVHNNGIVNATYLAKARSLARHADGEKLEIPETYHRDSWETIRKVVNDVCDAAIKKVK